MARPIHQVGPDARQVQDQAGPAVGAPNEAGRILEADVTAALRTGDGHGFGVPPPATRSPQFVQKVVPGGSGVWQWPQVSLAFRSAPHAGQNRAWTVTFFPH